MAPGSGQRQCSVLVPAVGAVDAHAGAASAAAGVVDVDVGVAKETGATILRAPTLWLRLMTPPCPWK
jgi:hypothetical protein